MAPSRPRARPQAPTAPEAMAHPTRQSRSRETLDRLLAAAEAILEEEGLEGATVPAIAGRAKMSVGIVYRRFPDKDALLRAVYVRLFERSREWNRAVLNPMHWQGVALPKMIRIMVAGMVKGYEDRKGLMRALLRYGETHPDPEFRRRADELSSEAFDAIGKLLLEHRDQIHHPDPPEAIRLALLVLALAVRGIVLHEGRRRLAGGRLSDELAAMMLGYLGVRGEK